MVANHLQDVRLSVHHVLILENLFDGDERVGMFLTSLKKLKTGKDKMRYFVIHNDWISVGV
jgi:hypothetical protein